MATKEELLKAKEEIEKQLKKLGEQEYSEKIVVLFTPDLTEGRISFYNKKEFYIKESKRDVENLIKLIEFIYSQKYGLYDAVMGSRYCLMKTFSVYIASVDSKDKNDLPVFEMNKLKQGFNASIEQIKEFLETVPTKSNTIF